MRANLTQSVDLILKHEGGYVDHPRDPGGCCPYKATVRIH
jgi:lysozyme family protein